MWNIPYNSCMKTLLAFIFLIMLIVTVHEGGHLLFAKLFNVYCSEFSIGMGPELYRKKNKETDFVIRLLPIGGFCSMAGESEDLVEKRKKIDVPKERTIKGCDKWKQVIIYLAGVVMNFILGFVVIVIAVMTIKTDGVNIGFVQALQRAPSIFSTYALAVIEGLKTLLFQPTQISGVVGIYAQTGEILSNGLTYYLMLIALISINVGIFNLLPLPVMDGGRVLILIIESIMGHDLDKKLEETIMLICAGLLILLMLWAFGLDVYRLIKGIDFFS